MGLVLTLLMKYFYSTKWAADSSGVVGEEKSMQYDLNEANLIEIQFLLFPPSVVMTVLY